MAAAARAERPPEILNVIRWMTGISRLPMSPWAILMTSSPLKSEFSDARKYG